MSGYDNDKEQWLLDIADDVSDREEWAELHGYHPQPAAMGHVPAVMAEDDDG